MKSTAFLIATALAAITHASSAPAAETAQLIYGRTMNLTDTLWYRSATATRGTAAAGG